MVEKNISYGGILQYLQEKSSYPDQCNDSPCTLQVLADEFQCSQQEMQQALQCLGAFDVNGIWYVLNEQLKRHTFSQMLDLLIEMDTSMQSVHVDQFAVLSTNAFILEQCLKEFGRAVNDAYALDPRKIAIFRAIELLENHEQHDLQCSVTEFLTKWALRLPEGVPIKLEYLESIALCWKSPDVEEERLLYFPHFRLPQEVQGRFEALFAFRSSWTLKELEPYIREFVTPSITQASLLVKYTRASRIPNTTDYVYSAR